MENQSTSKNLVTGMFTDRDSAERAYDSIKNKGYTDNDVNLLMSSDTRKHFADTEEKTELGNKALKGAGAGSAIGGTIGAIAGIVVALGTSLLIPGLGIVIAGPLAAGVAGAGAGGATGGIIGALIGAGIPEERAVVYERGIKDGHIVLGVHAHNNEDARFVEDIMRNNDAVEIHN